MSNFQSESVDRLFQVILSLETKEDCYRLFEDLCTIKEVQDMAMRYVEVDVQQVIAALRSFPFEIGCEWLAGNTDLFARRLYYAQIPRTDILKLFSLIVLYDRACRRVQPSPVQPAVGVNLGGGCQLSVSTLENHGTMMNIEQARILPKH